MKYTASSKIWLSILLLVVSAMVPSTHAKVAAQTQPEVVLLGDIIDVDVVGGFEFDWRGGLTPEGFLDGFQNYGEPIFAQCRTEAEIAADIAKSLSKILRDPNVVVRIVDRTGRALARLDGAVKTPTRFRINRSVHLRELIVMSGGLTDDASGMIRIFTSRSANCKAPEPAGDNGPVTRDIKITDLLSGKKEADAEIFPGDIVTIERASPVYLIGAVANPGPIYSRTQLTVTRAIASAGGLPKNADAGQISIFRREGTETKVIEVDLTKIKIGEAGDELLRPFDILDVASKGGARRKYPPVAVTDSGRKREMPLKVVD